MRTINEQDVLDIIDDLRDQMTVVCYWSVIERIKALPSAQPETHEERTETHECDCTKCDEYDNEMKDCPHYCEVMRSTADGLQVEAYCNKRKQPERTGRWIHDGFDHPHGVDWCHCSICGNRESVNSVYTQVDIYPYCAKCGAKMEVEHDLGRTTE